MQELKNTLEQIGDAFVDFRAVNDQRLDKIEDNIDALDTAIGRQMSPFGGHGSSVSVSGNPAVQEHARAFNAWARHGTDPDGLSKIQAGLSTLSDPDGGYLVPVEIERSIDKLAQSSVAMRRLGRIVTSRGEYTRPMSKGGTEGGWVAELAARPETAVSELALFAPVMQELYAMPTVSQKLLDMADFDVEGWLAEEISEVFTAKEGAAFISGTGVGAPHGILDEDRMVADASWEFGKTGFITSGNATSLVSADALISLQHALAPTYRANSTWIMSDATLAVIRKLKDGDGRWLWAPGLSEGSPDTLLGRPVEIDQNMPDIAAGTYPIAFGDFQRGYTIVDHVSGIRCIRDPFSHKGNVAFYTIKRISAGISNFQAIKFLKISE